MHGCTYNIAMARRKTRITIRIDDDVLAWFRRQVRPTRGSYQTAIDLALRDFVAREPLEATLRRVVREEIARADISSPLAYGYEESHRALVADDLGPEYGYGAPLKKRQRQRRSRPRKE